MAKLVEILDSQGIDSAHIESWIEESKKCDQFVSFFGLSSEVSKEKIFLTLVPKINFSETAEAEKLRLESYANIDTIIDGSNG